MNLPRAPRGVTLVLIHQVRSTSPVDFNSVTITDHLLSISIQAYRCGES